jgi:RNA polymerase sigma factor for flagellar operon FliA
MDDQERERLVIDNLQRVKGIARMMTRRVKSHTFEWEDAVGYGNIGLLKAIDHYDPTKGGTFSTYVGQRIQGEILDNWCGSRLRRRGPTPFLVSLDLGIAWGEVESSKYKNDPPKFTLPVHHDIYLQKEPNQLNACYLREIRDILAAAINDLPKRERLVVSLYYYDELTMKEIGEVLGVNESRASQICTEGLAKLRDSLSGLKLCDKEVVRRATVNCACGCGKKIVAVNQFGRRRSFVHGHYSRVRHRKAL